MNHSANERRPGLLRRVIGRGSAHLDPVLDAEPAADATFDLVWRAQLKRRVLVVVGVLVCWTVAIEARLVDLQVFQHAELLERAAHQQQHDIRVPAKRGDVVDRNGQILAYSIDADTISAVPRTVRDPDITAAALCGALENCTAADEAAMLTSLSGNGLFANIRRFASPDDAARVRALELPGVVLSSESKRYYPNRELAAHLLGFVGTDGAGLAGIEAGYDAVIRGTDGRQLVEVDAKSHRLDSRVEVAPTTGATIELTIDRDLQFIAERELRAGIEAHHAKAGTAIVMDPRTGEVLALANYPTFNPNNFKESSDDQRRNRGIQDLYEPGSTFKIVTASAALQENVMTPDEMIDTNPGWIKIPGRAKPVRDAEGHNHGVISFEDVVVLSSNVGAIKIGWKVGAERMSEYIHRFGFGEALSPDLSGESTGKVWPLAKINDVALASMAMGYQVGVTPLQMATAVSAVANGGVLYEPHVVRAIIRDDKRAAIAPKALRQAITAETAATVTSIMEDVALRGTGTKAQLASYQVAGKTGTAAKLVGGHYSETDYNASFVGFVPSRRPALTIVVVVDTPKGGSYFGGDVAAPIFQRIAEAALRHLAVPATLHPTTPVIMTANASTIASSREPRAVPLLTSLGGQLVVPDVRGLGARDALRLLGTAGLSMRVEGTGLVVEQTPAAGEPLERGGVGVLRLSRTPAAPVPHASGGGQR